MMEWVSVGEVGELETLNTGENNLWIDRFSGLPCLDFLRKMSPLQMNLVNACKRVAYGEVVLLGKKSLLFLKG
jgi:UDP-N-acetylglucosamine pyrophosphorylase